MAADFNSPWYPYERTSAAYNTFRGAELIPKLLIRYLMDLADANGYAPTDDNNRPRVRLMKYLYYDGPKPLAQTLPTDEEKRSIYYDGEDMAVNSEIDKILHPAGFRLYAQQYWVPATFDAKTTLKCYIGKVTPYSPFSASIGITFEIACNYANDTALRTNAYSRLFAMECALIEALHGVNITGVGVVDFNRMAHSDAGSRPYRDEGTHVFRYVNFSVQWAESSPPEGTTTTEYEE